MPAFLALLVAMVLVRWARGGQKLALLLGAADPPSRYLPFLGLHLLGFGAVFLLSHELFDRAPARSSSPGPLVACWLVAIAATLTAWLCSLWPPRALARWVREHGRLLAGAAGLGFAAFGVGRVSQALWLPLRRATFSSASFLLDAIVPGAFADPSTLTFGTDAFAVEIAPECSGYEGVGLAWTFLLAALWLFRDRLRFPRAFLLLAIATALTLLANVARLTALVLVGTFVSDKLAAGGFHSYAGSILFSAIALGTVSVGLRTRWFAHLSDDDPDELGSRDNPAAPYLVPFLVVTAVGLVSRAFATAEAEPLYPLRPLAALATLLAFRRSLAPERLRVSAWAVLAGVAVAAGWVALDRLLSPGQASAAAAAQGGRALALRAATAILLVPPIEELAFRGFLARRLTGPEFQEVPPSAIGLRGIVLSSAAFGLLHQRPVAAALTGVCYALIYKKRGRLVDAIVAHAATNAALVLLAWLTGAWDLWK
jgi:exosortase E/protease (VPEID-CTERM system)